MWIQDRKKQIKTQTDELYIQLSQNKYVKESLDKYLKFKEHKNKKLMNQKSMDQEDMKELLFKYCDENKCIPTKRTIYEQQTIGLWLRYQKSKIKFHTDDTYLKLSQNKYLNEELNRFLECKEVRKDTRLISQNTLKELLFKYCEENKYIPTNNTIYCDHKIGAWLQERKKKIKTQTDDTYVKLSENKYVKEELNKYLEKKQLRSTVVKNI